METQGSTPFVAETAAVSLAACSGCGSAAQHMDAAPPKVGFVYAAGKVEARFPSLSVEREYMQVIGRTDTSSLTDREVLHKVLSDPAARYVARRMCWILSVGGLETYVLQPVDAVDYTLLLNAIRPAPATDDLDVVVGLRGPLARPETCNGLTLPVVFVGQVYSFSAAQLLAALPIPKGAKEESFRRTAAELFQRVIGLGDNAGTSDEHRALNYLLLRYPAVYAKLAEMYAQDSSLAGIATHPVPSTSGRRMVDVVLQFRNRNTDFSEMHSVRVDVTEEFPFVARKLSPHFER